MKHERLHRNSQTDHLIYMNRTLQIFIKALQHLKADTAIDSNHDIIIYSGAFGYPALPDICKV